MRFSFLTHYPTELRFYDITKHISLSFSFLARQHSLALVVVMVWRLKEDEKTFPSFKDLHHVFYFNFISRVIAV
jgi:hypothetical protein